MAPHFLPHQQKERFLDGFLFFIIILFGFCVDTVLGRLIKRVGSALQLEDST